MVFVPATHLPLVRSAEYESADVYGVEFSEGKVSVVDYRHGEDVVWLWHEVVYWYIQKKDSQSERKSQVGYQHEAPHVLDKGIEILSYLRRPRALIRLR